MAGLELVLARLKGCARDWAYRACWLAARRSHAGARVALLYHSVGSGDPLSVPASAFAWQMQYLRERFHVVLLRDLPRAIAARTPEEPVASVTFDDGLLDNYERALPILDDFGVPATFFIPTGSIGRSHRAFFGDQPCMTAEHLRELSRRGHELGAHTIAHVDLTAVPPSRACREVSQSRTDLERLLGERVISFAYPKGRYDPSVKRSVAEAGFRCAATVEERLVPTAEPDWLALPRVWIHPAMSRLQFRAKLSPAVNFYQDMRQWIA